MPERVTPATVPATGDVAVDVIVGEDGVARCADFVPEERLGRKESQMAAYVSQVQAGL